MQSESTNEVSTEATGPSDWSDQIAQLLRELSGVQSDLLALLAKKRDLVAKHDSNGLNALHLEEEKLVARLQTCCQQRQELLDDAGKEGLPSASLTKLANSLPGESRASLRPSLKDTQRRSRLLQHQSLANWVLVQRSLLHLSQMMEIIATGGRMRPTYGRESSAVAGGALVDQAI